MRLYPHNLENKKEKPGLFLCYDLVLYSFVLVISAGANDCLERQVSKRPIM